ncbi:hypothetical protein WMO23_11460, partial [Megasphaera sp. CLA-AA-H81]
CVSYGKEGRLQQNEQKNSFCYSPFFLNHGMNAVRRPQVAGRRDPAYRKKHTTIGRVRRGRLGKAARREI